MKNLELQLKAIDGSHYSDKIDCCLDVARPDSWDVNIRFTQSSYQVALNMSYQQQDW